MWRIWRAPNNASKWQMRFNSAFKGLKDRVYKELEQVFDHFPEYHMKILLGDFNAKLRREDLSN
jgi:hypothetical protein